MHLLDDRNSKHNRRQYCLMFPLKLKGRVHGYLNKQLLLQPWASHSAILDVDKVIAEKRQKGITQPQHQTDLGSSPGSAT